MSKRKVYILRTAQLSDIDNKFHYYDTEVFSSKRKVMEGVDSRLKVNKAINVERDDHREYDLFVTYDCVSVEGRSMRGRYHVMEKVVR